MDVQASVKCFSTIMVCCLFCWFRLAKFRCLQKIRSGFFAVPDLCVLRFPPGFSLSLVWVFYKSLVFSGKRTHHRVVALVHNGLYVARPLVYGVDRLVYGEPQRVPVYPMPVAGAWHDVERAVDSQRHDGQLKFVGKRESPLLEHSHVA